MISIEWWRFWSYTVPHNLPPQKRSQIWVKHREDKVHEEEAIQFLSYEALPALQTAEASPKMSSPESVQRSSLQTVIAQCGLGTTTATSLTHIIVNLENVTFWFHGNSPEPSVTQHSNNADLKQQVPAKTPHSFWPPSASHQQICPGLSITLVSCSSFSPRKKGLFQCH